MAIDVGCESGKVMVELQETDRTFRHDGSVEVISSMLKGVSRVLAEHQTGRFA